MPLDLRYSCLALRCFGVAQARPGIGLKRTKSSTVAKKVNEKLRDRSQGSYMVCHFMPIKVRKHSQTARNCNIESANCLVCLRCPHQDTEERLLDDPPHRIATKCAPHYQGFVQHVVPCCLLHCDRSNSCTSPERLQHYDDFDILPFL